MLHSDLVTELAKAEQDVRYHQAAFQEAKKTARRIRKLLKATPMVAPVPVDLDSARKAREAYMRSCAEKKVYRTPDAAGSAAAYRRAAGAPELRVYKCTYCQHYHLTSATLEDFVGVGG